MEFTYEYLLKIKDEFEKMKEAQKLARIKSTSYFSYISSFYTCKNSLETEVTKCLSTEFNRIVLDSTGLENFKSNIISRINAINRQNARCKPITATWYKLNETGDLKLELPGILNFYIYKSTYN